MPFVVEFMVNEVLRVLNYFLSNNISTIDPIARCSQLLRLYKAVTFSVAVDLPQGTRMQLYRNVG
jgi:hypothetical protein